MPTSTEVNLRALNLKLLERLRDAENAYAAETAARKTAEKIIRQSLADKDDLRKTITVEAAARIHAEAALDKERAQINRWREDAEKRWKDEWERREVAEKKIRELETSGVGEVSFCSVETGDSNDNFIETSPLSQASTSIRVEEPRSALQHFFDTVHEWWNAALEWIRRTLRLDRSKDEKLPLLA